MAFNWFLDFDDTLVSGSTTWGVEFAIPKLVREHHLQYNPDTFQAALLVAQEEVTRNVHIDAALTALFEKMEWPQALTGELLKDVTSAYQPAIFDDCLPFLNRLRASEQPIYIISNNAHAPKIAVSLGIDEYITAFFTPKLFPDAQPKPHRSLWDTVQAKYPEIDARHSMIVGDDPWSDGVFAEACGLKCCIVDRRGSFTHLYHQKPYTWVKSLADIQIVGE